MRLGSPAPQAATILSPLALLIPPALVLGLWEAWITIDRVTVKVDPERLGIDPVILAILGTVGAASLIYSAMSGQARRLAALVAAALVALEAAFASSVLLLEAGHSWAVGLVVVERGFWALLGLSYLFALQAALAIQASRRLPILHNYVKGLVGAVSARIDRLYGGGGGFYLIPALAVAVVSVLIPHSPPLNPSMTIVSTDSYYNLLWIESFEREGFIATLTGNPQLLRPLYMAYLYASWRLAPVPEEVLVDVVIPLIGLLLLALSTYWAASAIGADAGYVALASILYWSPAFIYAGFQTNLYALSMAMAATGFLWRGRHAHFLALAVLLGLWHPWTLAYYAAAWILGSPGWRARLRTAAYLALSFLAAAIVNYTVALASGDPRVVVGPVAEPLTLEPSIGGALFSVYVYVWGTMMRPEILLPSALAMASRRVEWRVKAMVIPAVFHPLLAPPYSYRLLLEAPLPLLLHGLRNPLRRLILASATASWLYLIINSPPAAAPATTKYYIDIQG